MYTVKEHVMTQAIDTTGLYIIAFTVLNNIQVAYGFYIQVVSCFYYLYIFIGFNFYIPKCVFSYIYYLCWLLLLLLFYNTI